MNLKLIYFAISIIQFSVCHRISTKAYKNNDNLNPIFVNCDEDALNPSIFDNLNDIVNISSVPAVSFENCQIVEYSDILNQFPNISKLIFSKDNILPSSNFSSFEHLTLFKSADSTINTTTTSATQLSMNAADLKLFYFKADQTSNRLSSISLQNATQLVFFYLKNTLVSNLPADLFKSSNNLTMIHTPNNKIEDIDSMNWPSSVRYMEFSSNEISQLTRNSFKNLTNLQTLELQHNKISQIEAETFSQLKNLIHLDLSSNRIREISKNMLKGLNNLMIADFSRNKINYIEDGAFESTPILFSLYLPFNNSSSLNPHTFAGLNSSLLVLELYSGSYRELSAELFNNLSQLRYLSMRGGRLETIDFNTFASMPKLGYLSLKGNNISRLVKMAPTAWNNNNQTTSNKFRNELTEIVNGIDFTWVKPFMTRAGPLESEVIRDHFGFTPDESSLKDRILKSLVFYPKLEKGSNYGLKTLDLSFNQLVEVEKNIFDEFKSLIQLILEDNPITTLYPESFAGLNELEELYLNYCKLTSIDFSIFKHLTKLKRLDVARNQLTMITAVPLPSVVHLALHGNQLTQFALQKINLPNLKIFLIYNNPLNCSAINPSFPNVESFVCY